MPSNLHNQRLSSSIHQVFIHNVWHIALLHFVLGLSADTWNKLFQDAAIVVGGLAAYYRWFKGRPYKGRLELIVTGTVTEVGDYFYIIANVSIKNIGLTKLEIKQGNTVLEFYCCKLSAGANRPTPPMWEELGSDCVFIKPKTKNNEYIEGGETIQDQKIMAVPKRDIDAVQIILEVGAGANRWVQNAIIVPQRKNRLHRRQDIL